MIVPIVAMVEVISETVSEVVPIDILIELEALFGTVRAEKESVITRGLGYRSASAASLRAQSREIRNVAHFGSQTASRQLVHANRFRRAGRARSRARPSGRWRGSRGWFWGRRRGTASVASLWAPRRVGWNPAQCRSEAANAHPVLADGFRWSGRRTLWASGSSWALGSGHALGSSSTSSGRRLSGRSGSGRWTTRSSASSSGRWSRRSRRLTSSGRGLPRGRRCLTASGRGWFARSGGCRTAGCCGGGLSGASARTASGSRLGRWSSCGGGSWWLRWRLSGGRLSRSGSRRLSWRQRRRLCWSFSFWLSRRSLRRGRLGLWFR